MTDTPLDAFVRLAVVLTGFDRHAIADPLDPDQLATVYFGVVTTAASPTLDALLAAFRQAETDSGGDEHTLIEAVRAGLWNDGTLGPLARKITCLWYLGRWNGGDLVSEAAYIRALAWPAMEAKAIGYSEFTDQSWARPPTGAEST